MDSGLVGVDSVNEKGSTSRNIVDGVLDDRLDTGTLGNNVETVYNVSSNHWELPVNQKADVRGFSFLI